MSRCQNNPGDSTHEPDLEQHRDNRAQRREITFAHQPYVYCYLANRIGGLEQVQALTAWVEVRLSAFTQVLGGDPFGRNLEARRTNQDSRHS